MGLSLSQFGACLLWLVEREVAEFVGRVEPRPSRDALVVTEDHHGPLGEPHREGVQVVSLQR